MQTYYLVKYVMSLGIEACDGMPLDSNPLTIDIPGRCGYYRLDRDVFTDRNEAVAAARALQAKRIKSLRKQLANAEAVEIV